MSEHFLDDQLRLTESEEINVDGNITRENKIAHDATQLCPHSMAPHSLAPDQKLARNIPSEPDMESAYGTGSHSAQVDDENDSIANGTKIVSEAENATRMKEHLIESLKKKVEGQSNEISALNKVINDLEVRLSNKITEDVENAKCMMKNWKKEELTNLERKNKSLEKELEYEKHTSQRIQDLRDEVERVNAEHDDMELRIQDLRDEVERVNAERDDMELRFATNKTPPPKTSSVQTQTQQTLEMQTTRPTMTMRMQQALASSGVRPFVDPLRFPIQETAQHGDFQEAQQEEEDDASSELCLQ